MSSDQECPHCGEGLDWDDYYGPLRHAKEYWTHPQTWIEKAGDIYRCQNESCEHFQDHFYTRNGELNEGYPC